MSRRALTTFWPLRSSLASMEAKRPSMWWRASTTTALAQRPEPDTMVAGGAAATTVRAAARAMELRTAKGPLSSLSRPLQPHPQTLIHRASTRACSEPRALAECVGAKRVDGRTGENSDAFHLIIWFSSSSSPIFTTKPLTN